MLIVRNQPRIGAHFSPTPDASNQDGLAHVCAVRAPRSRLRLLWICYRIFRGVPERCPEVTQLKGRAFTIRSERDQTFFGDGEILATAREFTVRVLPSALRVASGRVETRSPEPQHA